MGRKNQNSQENTPFEGQNDEFRHQQRLEPALEEKPSPIMLKPQKRRIIRKNSKPQKVQKEKISRPNKSKKQRLCDQSQEKNENIEASKKKQKTWTQEQRKKFCMFTIQQLINCPRYLLSWKYWKPIFYYIKMQDFVTSKLEEQSKSYDQRQKKSAGALDLIEHCVKVLVEEFVKSNRDEEVVSLLRTFRQKLNTQSQFNKFITLKLNQNSDMFTVQEIADYKRALKKTES